MKLGHGSTISVSHPKTLVKLPLLLSIWMSNPMALPFKDFSIKLPCWALWRGTKQKLSKPMHFWGTRRKIAQAIERVIRPECCMISWLWYEQNWKSRKNLVKLLTGTSWPGFCNSGRFMVSHEIDIWNLHFKKPGKCFSFSLKFVRRSANFCKVCEMKNLIIFEKFCISHEGP